VQVSSYMTAERVERRALPSGLTVLAQHVPATYSVVIGVWVRVGSRDEDSHGAGISHFIEHMVFKGTEKRSAYELALALERVGGSLEAHTTKEYTCFYTRVLREHLDLALDVISDLVLRPTMMPDQIELEQGVVIEEINNVYDTPDDWIFEIMAEKVYGAHPLARPILGTRESVRAITQADLRAFMARHYVGGNVIISVAGDIEVEPVLAKIAVAFPFGPGKVPHATAAAEPTRQAIHLQVDEALTQQYLVLSSTTMSYEDDDRYALLITSTLLGGGMSSRLFQSVRENAGLCYAVSSGTEFARDAGMASTFLAVSPENTRPALDLVWLEFDKLCREGVSQRELEDTRDQLKGSMLLGMENVASRMSRMAKNEMYYARQVPISEILQKLDDVTCDDVARMADRFLRRERSYLIGLGPVTGLD
jgi:predicted Zn-dependent peptidase